MANELRKVQNFLGGLIEDNPLTAGATTMNSAGFSAIAGGVGSTEHMVIVLDPDGLAGAPEIAYVTAQTAGTGSATIARGKEGTTAREHARDIPWVHSLAASDVHSNRFIVRTQNAAAGNDYVLNSAIYAPIDATNLSISVVAQAGDVLEVGLAFRLQPIASNNQVYFDAVAIGSTNYMSGVGSGGDGFSGWTGQNHYMDTSFVGPEQTICGSLFYTVVSGDISGGQVTVRPYYKQSAATARNIYCRATIPLQFSVKNLGPQTV